MIEISVKSMPIIETNFGYILHPNNYVMKYSI